MATIPTRADTPPTELVLKTIAPRVSAQLLARARLGAGDAQFRDRQVTLVQAPAGYGKTSLLAQWRREYLAQGHAVVWLSADERDDAQRLLQGLVQAVRTGCARPGCGRLLAGGAMDAARALEGVTAWLAEVAQLSLDALLIVDEAERLPPGGMDALTYVLHNAPQNLRIVVAARRGLDQNKWFGSVEYVAAEKIGQETVTYVRNIYKYYIAYQLILESRATRSASVEKLKSNKH